MTVSLNKRYSGHWKTTEVTDDQRTLRGGMWRKKWRWQDSGTDAGR